MLMYARLTEIDFNWTQIRSLRIPYINIFKKKKRKKDYDWMVQQQQQQQQKLIASVCHHLIVKSVISLEKKSVERNRWTDEWTND